MTSKELRKLSRRDLLELLVQQEEQNEKLQAKVTELEERLQDRAVEIEKAGSLAEATVSLNSVFEAADKAAAQYLDNIKRCSEQQKSINDKMMADAEQKAREILLDAEDERQQKINEADEYWKNLSAKMEEFYREHIGLQELLSVQYKNASENTNTSENT